MARLGSGIQPAAGSYGGRERGGVGEREYGSFMAVRSKVSASSSIRRRCTPVGILRGDGSHLIFLRLTFLTYKMELVMEGKR